MKKQYTAKYRYLRPVELAMLVLVFFIVLTDSILVWFWGLNIAYDEYAIVILFVFSMLIVGLNCRSFNCSEALASVMICMGLMVAFTTSTALLNYLFLPNDRIWMDLWLLKIDASLGYSWADMVGWSVQHPFSNELMRQAYQSILPQMAILMILLGLTGKIQQLHALIMTLMISALCAVVFWIIFPTAGPSAYLVLSPETAAISHQALDKAYGQQMLDLLSHGAAQIRPSEMIGLIAFPSYHTVLALAGIWFSRSLKWLFPAFLIVNLTVLPATLAHGGHYLVDLAGGLVLFLVSLWATERFQRRFDPQETAAINHQLQRTSMIRQA